ncbi:MAG TPA: rhodanese-like domain-containing protein [Pyrinomonadaceae bacterium]|nr:rhodanese-like domain-containing protein [Pyrinomonadaceae bacterium]
MDYQEILPREVDEKMRRGERLRLIDVREPVEFELARVEGAELLPMSRLLSWIDSLNPDDALIVMCHHGVRSAHVCRYLVERGYRHVSNLVGGIDLWSAQVDENVPRY